MTFTEKEIIRAYQFIKDEMHPVYEALNTLEIAWATEASYNTTIEQAALFWDTMRADIKILELDSMEAELANKQISGLTHDLLVSLYELYENMQWFKLKAKDNAFVLASVALRACMSHGNKGRRPWYVKLEREDAKFEWALGIDLAFVSSELGQTAMRLHKPNRLYIVGIAENGERYVNISRILEKTIAHLESEYASISKTLGARVANSKEFLESDLDMQVPVPEIVRHLISHHIGEDMHRVEMKKENDDLLSVVPPDEDDE